MSITRRWRMLLILTALVLVTGAILAVFLSLGLADPPRAGTTLWAVQSPDTWSEQSINSELVLLEAPDELPGYYTLELSARNVGPPDSVWGIQLMDAELLLTILIDNQGYYSIHSTEPQWVEFPHIQPGQANKLYLHVQQDGTTALRINDEAVTESTTFSVTFDHWGIIMYRQPNLHWKSIMLYTDTNLEVTGTHDR